MKKFIIFFAVFVLTVSSALALSKPRWETRPIKVYIPGNTYYSQIMKNAFLQWQTRTDSAVWFNFLGENRKNEADITVHFVEKNTNCGSLSAIGCTHYKINHHGFYTHNDIFIASKSVQQLVGDDGVVATKTTPIPSAQVYRVMLHEIGHAIGINTHSSKPGSVMYAYSLGDNIIPQTLNDDDLNFVYNVYR